MQSKDDLEKWYQDEDPWEYATNPDDHHRKDEILKALKGKKFNRGLDIGAGEGWVTQYLPAKEIHAIELSDTAAQRFPKNVKRVEEPHGMYDLIVTTGTLYPQYDYQQIIDWINQYAQDTILIAGIKGWLVDNPFGKPVTETEFKYREFTQVIKVYKV